MKIVGLVTEYNPFHNGHQYHMEKSKEITGADAVIAVMSGNFVQRGTPAIMPKHLRAEAALQTGVDVVIELPVCYAVGSAEYFAMGAISLFDKLNCIDSICFGSECGDIKKMEQLARLFVDEPVQYKEYLSDYLRNGFSFPRARQAAAKKYLGDTELSTVLEHPNNILGIEYLKALLTLKSSIQAHTIKRKESDHHNTELSERYSSASAIRNLISAKGAKSNSLQLEPIPPDLLTLLSGQIPEQSIPFLEDNYRTRYPVYTNDFSIILRYKLLSETRSSITQYMDISEDLGNRIINRMNDFISFEQFCDLLKTREITYARISRALIHVLLDIKKEHLSTYQAHGYHQYARMLGFREAASNVLTLIKKYSSIPLITKPTVERLLNPVGKQILSNDLYAAHIYESAITNKYRAPFSSEYEHAVIRVL